MIKNIKIYYLNLDQENFLYQEGDIFDLSSINVKDNPFEKKLFYIYLKYKDSTKYNESFDCFIASKHKENDYACILLERINHLVNEETIKQANLISENQKLIYFDSYIPFYQSVFEIYENQIEYIVSIVQRAKRFYNLLKSWVENNLILRDDDIAYEEILNNPEENDIKYYLFNNISKCSCFDEKEDISERINIFLGIRLIRIILKNIDKKNFTNNIKVLFYSDYYNLCLGFHFFTQKFKNYDKIVKEIDTLSSEEFDKMIKIEIIQKKILILKKILEELTGPENFIDFVKIPIKKIEEADSKIKMLTSPVSKKAPTLRQKSTRPSEWELKIQEIENELEEMGKNHPEYPSKKNLYNYLVNIPHDHMKKVLNLDDIKLQIEKTHYGHEDIKKSIQEYIYEILYSQKTDTKTICLVGPPGTGKSSIALSISKALCRDFFRVSMGAVDHKYLLGHSPTYINSKPGIIMENFSKLKQNDPVILLDEIDKIPLRDSPFGTLMEILDPELSKSFKDHFISLPYDLSKALIICTANSIENIEPALLSRMDIFELSSYTYEEKMEIAKNYIVKKLQINFNSKLKISDEIIGLLISKYTYEGGVRDLSSQIKKIFIKTLMADKEAKEINVSILDTLEEIRNDDPIVDTRYESPETMFALSVDSSGNGRLITISTIKEEILSTKEEPLVLVNTSKSDNGAGFKISSTIAYQYITSKYKFKNTQLVMTFTPISLTAAGTSAGLSMSIAFYKILNNLRGCYAATGQLDIAGYIGSVGGIKEKVLEAQRRNIKHIFIPLNNEPQYNRIKHLIKIDTKIYLVKHFDEVIEILNKINDEVVRNSDSFITRAKKR